MDLSSIALWYGIIRPCHKIINPQCFAPDVALKAILIGPAVFYRPNFNQVGAVPQGFIVLFQIVSLRTPVAALWILFLQIFSGLCRFIIAEL